MIKIRKIIKRENDVVITCDIHVEDEIIYQEIIVDPFDIDNSTIGDVENIVKSEMDRDDFNSLLVSRKKQKQNTYTHDGQSFRSEVIIEDWESDRLYDINELVFFNDKIYRCVQSHTSQSTWTPTATAALWSPIVLFSGEYPNWQQPQGAHDAYPENSIVSHNDGVWISLVSANVWEPGTDETLWDEYDPNEQIDGEDAGEDPIGDGEDVPDEWAPETTYVIDDTVTYEDIWYVCIQDHTSQVGWEPPNVPALWEVF